MVIVNTSRWLIAHLEYHRWATSLILEKATALPSEQLLRTLGGSFPSLYETLVHLYQADCVWLDRLEQRPSGKLSDYEAPGCMWEFREAWLAIHDRMITFVSALREDELENEIAYKSLAGQPFSSPVWQILMHVVNHGTHHRAQVTAMFRQLGEKPVNLDLIRFYRESPALEPHQA